MLETAGQDAARQPWVLTPGTTGHGYGVEVAGVTEYKVVLPSTKLG